MSSAKEALKKQLALMLGHQMADVDLDNEHYDLSVVLALEKFRQRSGGAVYEDDISLEVSPDLQEYTLPAEVQDVRRIYRRGIGPTTSGGADFDPATAMVYNAYLTPSGKAGGLTTWDLYHGYLETAERLMASQYNFVWYNHEKRLRIIRKPLAEETVLVRVFKAKEDDSIITDVLSAPWIRAYSLAQCKHMLGQARSKFVNGFAGPKGNVQLNGTQLMQEALQEMERLEKELDNQRAGGDGYSFIIG